MLVLLRITINAMYYFYENKGKTLFCCIFAGALPRVFAMLSVELITFSSSSIRYQYRYRHIQPVSVSSSSNVDNFANPGRY